MSVRMPRLRVNTAGECVADNIPGQNKDVNNELQSQYDMNRSGRVLSSALQHPNEISVCGFHYGATRLIQMAGWGHPRPHPILSQSYQPPRRIPG